MAQQKGKDYEDQCMEFWNLADKNGDGFVTIQELVPAMQAYYKKYYPGKPVPSDQHIARMLCDLDKDGDKRVDKQEFIDELIRKPTRLEGMKKLFKELDSDNSGTLCRAEVRQLVMAGKCKKVDELTDAIMEEGDKDKSGSISLDEFLACVM